MALVYLVRHGEADYQPVRHRGWPGSVADLAPLSGLGVEQAREAAGGRGRHCGGGLAHDAHPADGGESRRWESVHRQLDWVLRGGIEPPTFGFQKVCRCRTS